MTAGRPTKYDPAMCEAVLPFMEQGYSTTALAGHTVIYALCRSDWTPFYIGKSKNMTKRLQAYKSQRSHGNPALGDELKKWSKHQNYMILEVDPDDVTASEYKWINKTPNLCNIMLKPFYAQSSKPWVAPGVKCPTAQIRMHVKRNLGGNVDWIKSHAESLDEQSRLELECRMALAFMHTCLGASLQKWADRVAA